MRTYEEFIATVTISMKIAVGKIRSIILQSSESIEEEIKWSTPIYSIKKNICSIHVHKDHINLQFFYGAQLGVNGMLEGNGDNMRHLKIMPRTVIDDKVIKSLLVKAIEYDRLLD